MTSKHTPGLWRAGEMTMSKRDWATMCGDSMTIVQSGSDVIAVVWADDDDEEKANARVCAASPEMLRILKEIVSQLWQGGEDGKIFWRDDCVRQSVEIIAKAEGRS